MPLFDAKRDTVVDPKDAVVVVHRFLLRCKAWAEELEIPKREAQLAEDPSPALQKKLDAWHSYLAFTEHTLKELEDGTLDRWFHAPNEPK